MRRALSALALGTCAVAVAGCSKENPPPAASSATPPASAPAVTVVDAGPPAVVDAGATASAEADDENTPDIEFVPTPMQVVDKMFEVAKIQKNDVLYDLGCGDGRIVVQAAKRYGIKAVGFDIDPQRIKESNENAKQNGVESLVRFEQKNIFSVDLTPASVVTLYLLPELNVRLIPQLEKLKPGSRIIAHDFDMEGVEPVKWWTVIAKDHREVTKDREHYVYLWKTPLQKTKPKAK
ncbi:MAG: methyltransferase domain-containing protein [Labilithrix sp.]|nr:methyltransferase domain-containing protein [Labilithrix sp.]MCW5816808.1 methyltransferase domain-containing protein [Labilithrix sp.]